MNILLYTYTLTAISPETILMLLNNSCISFARGCQDTLKLMDRGRRGNKRSVDTFSNDRAVSLLDSREYCFAFRNSCSQTHVRIVLFFETTFESIFLQQISNSA